MTRSFGSPCHSARRQWTPKPNPESRGHSATVAGVTEESDGLEALDRELLNAVQWDFPLVPEPYAALGDRLGLSEVEVRERVARVKELGVLRQLSAIFDTRALGYSSSLVAAKVPPEYIDEGAAK